MPNQSLRDGNYLGHGNVGTSSDVIAADILRTGSFTNNVISEK